MPPSRQDLRARANARAAEWRQSDRIYHDRHREANRQAWLQFHLERAATALEVARALSAKHVAAAAALAKEDQEADA